MSSRYLGETFDIHAGGEDLIFPHHENEIAQSEAVSGRTFARYWLHNGYLKIDNKKMSKSLGNILTIRELSQRYDGSVIRHFLLSAHYRSPLNYSIEQLEQSKNSMETLNNLIYNLKFLSERKLLSKQIDADSKKLNKTVDEMKDRFIKAMDDDFNTPIALSTLFFLAKETNIYLNRAKNKNKETIENIIQFYEDFGLNILGLKLYTIPTDQESLPGKEIKDLIDKREIARKNRDWETADQIRVKLLNMGIVIEDTKEGVRWKKS